MIYRTVIWKDGSVLVKPSDMTDDEWNTYLTEVKDNLTDFETNYKDKITNVISEKKYPYDVEIDYKTFVGKITDWSTVIMRDGKDRYVLYVEVD